MALLTGQSLPRPTILIATLLLGLVSYGVSLVLDMRALRLLGAAREAGFFSIAPFVGAIAAVPILGEQWEINMLMHEPPALRRDAKATRAGLASCTHRVRSDRG